MARMKRAEKPRIPATPLPTTATRKAQAHPACRAGRAGQGRRGPQDPLRVRPAPAARAAFRPDRCERPLARAIGDGAPARFDFRRSAPACRGVARPPTVAEWAGKRERSGFDVDPVALHIHERVSAQAILKLALREPTQRSLFADPEMEYREAVRFYQHDVDWANRLILGDSLTVMGSLARREDLAGKVQMIYMDPPYGIKFASNFQAQVSRRDVKDKEEDLTREPEQIKAYRDTWTLGVHSYLAYLRDRLIVAHELLSDTGSIFVQISDENLHRVRTVMDEVFGADNFVAQIAFVTSTGRTSATVPVVNDYLLWYARSLDQIKYRTVGTEKDAQEGDDQSSWQVSTLRVSLPTATCPLSLKGESSTLPKVDTGVTAPIQE